MKRGETLRTWHGPTLIGVPGLVFIGFGLGLIPQDWGWAWASVIAGCGLYLLLAGILWRVKVDEGRVTIFDESLRGLLGRKTVTLVDVRATGIEGGVLLHVPVIVTRDGLTRPLRPLSRYRPSKALETSRRLAELLDVDQPDS